MEDNCVIVWHRADGDYFEGRDRIGRVCWRFAWPYRIRRLGAYRYAPGAAHERATALGRMGRSVSVGSE